MSYSEEIKARYAKALMGNYGLPPVAIREGEGRTVTDVDGNAYLDMIGGIAVSSLGHNHPALVEAVSVQAARLAHTSNLFLHEKEVELAEKLLDLWGNPGRVFLCNSGTEANEAALKIALLHGKAEGRTRIVATENGFHGRTLGALSITGKAAIREPFEPLGRDVVFVPYGDLDALKAAVDDSVAAVFFEPTQGETGVIPAPAGYLKAARELTAENGTLLILDEIQSGFGRTGAWFAHHAEGIVPDVVTLAKGLGGGVPIGAVLATEEAAALFTKGVHGSTFGGNPIACAASLAVIDTIEREHLFENVLALGEHLDARLLADPRVTEVRGQALWRGINLAEPVAGAVVEHLIGLGVLANAPRPDTVRIAPPLTITRPELDAFCDKLIASLDAVPHPSPRPPAPLRDASPQTGGASPHKPHGPGGRP
ncbi:acetylornithine transaminase [Glycomyces harbinensis]|uniref:Acetylornithine aminotransferase n=1 Tax=Glycomyces harbinensis TaxID=58114 RepID=A0A1G6SDM6_9ACTN|nr:acetylornithine transaminase [Glycomyces harbinensis]SDD14979.1 acetylornithine aminotransferase [Glycomyces harbinensis]